MKNGSVSTVCKSPCVHGISVFFSWALICVEKGGAEQGLRRGGLYVDISSRCKHERYSDSTLIAQRMLVIYIYSQQRTEDIYYTFPSSCNRQEKHPDHLDF